MKARKRSPIKIVLLGLASAALVFSGVQTTRAALSVQSNYYRAQASMEDISIAIVENGKVQTDALLQDLIVKSTGEKASDFSYGTSYKENLAVKNVGDIEQYVRVIVRKYWVNEADSKLVELDPSLIKINYTGNWITDTANSTDEREILYYTKTLQPDQVSTDFADAIKVDGTVQLIGTYSRIDENGDTFVTYVYDGDDFVISCEAQGVQTHNAKDAVTSAWGKEACDLLTRAGVIK